MATKSQGNEALMLRLSLHHYYAQQKHNTTTSLYTNTKYYTLDSRQAPPEETSKKELHGWKLLWKFPFSIVKVEFVIIICNETFDLVRFFGMLLIKGSSRKWFT